MKTILGGLVITQIFGTVFAENKGSSSSTIIGVKNKVDGEFNGVVGNVNDVFGSSNGVFGDNNLIFGNGNLAG
jgi:hypothetical protein